MFVERVRDHFQRAGWTVEEGPVLRAAVGPPVKADLRIQRRGQRRVVLVRADPPGPFEIARFAQLCKRAGLHGMVVAPDDAAVAALCEEQGVDLFPAHTVGEVAVVGGPRPRPPTRAPPAQAPPRPRTPPVAPPAAAPSIPAWRWAVVAAIWAVALALVVYDLVRLIG